MIKKTVRDLVYSIETYITKIRNGYICSNADVQRLAGSFDNKELNEIIYTILTDDHIPELILAECNEDDITYILDGLQRTTMILKFLFGNYKITSSIDNPFVTYMGKKIDENNNPVKNQRGQIEMEEKTIDIRNKTFDALPEELQQQFKNFQLRITIHEDCDMKRISSLIKRYNTHKAMNSSQQAFTYLDNYAVSVRRILEGKFFVECPGYTEKEKINGTMERVITESIMCINHLYNWKKTSKATCEYLNVNSSNKEFSNFENLIERLGNIVTPDFKKVFTSKDSFIWFNIFNKFTMYGLYDSKFAEFLEKFNSELHNKEVNGITYDELDEKKNTKDKSLIMDKLNLIESLMSEYLHINNIEKTQPEIVCFVKENIFKEVTDEDIDFYEDMLNDLSLNIDNKTKLLYTQNHPSLIGIIAYSIRQDIDLDNWFISYFKNHNTYIVNQKDNYVAMKADLEEYMANEQSKISA